MDSRYWRSAPRAVSVPALPCQTRHASPCRSRVFALAPAARPGRLRTGSPLGAQARYFMAAPRVAGSGSLNEMALLGQSSMQTEQWMHSSG